jgi:hypothetical protein
MKELMVEWRKWHIEEFRNLCSSLSIIKLMSIMWSVCVCYTHDRYERGKQVKLENLVKRNNWRDIDIDRKMVLRRILSETCEGYSSVADLRLQVLLCYLLLYWQSPCEAVNC